MRQIIVQAIIVSLADRLACAGTSSRCQGNCCSRPLIRSCCQSPDKESESVQNPDCRPITNISLDDYQHVLTATTTTGQRQDITFQDIYTLIIKK
ncbi:hypothetical protein RB195_013117 [Necator americanus]|uniref:Uncharacterized protein n=1 Tax=Necator americanus TaxID=51031 RepID=A0ABR1DU20_NECAM